MAMEELLPISIVYSFSFSLVYLPIKAPTHEQNNLNNTNTTKHIYRVPVIIYNTSNTVFCVGDAMTHHEGQNNYYTFYNQ